MTLAAGRRLEEVPESTLVTVALASVGGFAALSLPMQLWEQRMRSTGGPGIVGLQLAADPPAVQAVLVQWGPEGSAAARQQTWADFAYLTSYACAGVCGGELLRRRVSPGSWWDRSGRMVRWLPVVAATCDAVENVLLLRTLSATERGEAVDGRTVRATRTAALTKFTLLLGSIGWAMGAAAVGRRSSRVG